MARRGTVRPGFSDAEIVRLLGLVKDSHTVALMVKLRPVVPGQVAAKLRKLPGFGIEVDAMPGGFVCSGRLKVALGATGVSTAVAGKTPLRKLFSTEQRDLFATHAPDGIGLDDLSILGPIFVLKLRFRPEEFGRKLVAEMWLYPDGSRLLELSTRCAPSEAFEVAAELRAFLATHGVDLSGEQETKTRKALEYFSKSLQNKTSDRAVAAPARSRSRSKASRP
jgi:hypothetical protein